MGYQDVPLRERTEAFSCKSKPMNFPFLLDIAAIEKLSQPIPLQIIDHMLQKKVSLMVFRQILPKILFAVDIFSYTITTYLKKLDGTKPLNTKQCPLGLSPRFIPQESPFLPNIFPL